MEKVGVWSRPGCLGLLLSDEPNHIAIGDAPGLSTWRLAVSHLCCLHVCRMGMLGPK